jgi:two-component system response regulator YesN
MPRLLLVEDEPSAVRYLRSIIETRCAGFEVVDTAGNGAEALEKIRRLLPDIAITDIKMPVMDGIELASRIGREFPFMYTVIVSGYQEFEYARRALSSGVVDYLLKPVNAGQLKKLLESIGGKLAKDYYAKRIELLGLVLAGASVEPRQHERYLPYAQYGIAMLRSGGLPPRHHVRRRERDVARAAERMKESFEEHDIWTLPGRDSSELLFVHAPERTRMEAFRKAVVSLSESLGGIFRTVFFQPGTFPLDGIASGAAVLSRAMDSAIVIGRSQVLHGSEEPRPAQDGIVALDPALGSRIDYLISNAMYGGLEEELQKLFLSWESEGRQQVWVETHLRQIFHLIVKKSPGGGALMGEDFEFLLDDAVNGAATFGELAENAWSLAARILQCAPAPRRGTDVPALLESIERYVGENYADPVTLQSVCELFGVSQTYLSRLFRRHEGASFNDYLTGIRIEAAKKLITRNPGMPLKDVAAFVGYHDQFYFSRVFKSVTGAPPSEYARRDPSPGV